MSNSAILAAAAERKAKNRELTPASMPGIDEKPSSEAVVTKWRVVKGGSFSTGGGLMASVKADQIIHLTAYGNEGIKRMLDRGVVLEPIVE